MASKAHVSEIYVTVQLAPGEIRALAALSERHPHTLASVSARRKQGREDWGSSVSFSQRTNEWPFERCTSYVVSPTGRAWVSPDGVERGELVREADFDWPGDD